jgi:hypothetical protein
MMEGPFVPGWEEKQPEQEPQIPHIRPVATVYSKLKPQPLSLRANRPRPFQDFECAQCVRMYLYRAINSGNYRQIATKKFGGMQLFHVEQLRLSAEPMGVNCSTWNIFR